VLEGLGAHIAVLDENGVVKGINKPWHEFVATNSNHFPGFIPGSNYMDAAMEMVSSSGDQDLGKMIAGIQNVAAGNFSKFELRYAVHSENSDIWLQVEVSPLSPGVLIFHRDITEQEKEEKHRHQASKMEAIGTLAGGIAHDFNNILAGILGYSELVKEDIEALGGADEKTHERLDHIIGASIRARDLIRQILTFSRSGREEKHPVLVNAMVKEVAKFLRASLPANIEIHQSLNSNSLVMADPTHIHQILMNLCANSRDAMGETGGILSILLDDVNLTGEIVLDGGKCLSGEFIRLGVGDTGTGIESDIAGKIMEPFFTTKPKEKGTGMGLSMVHGIVKNLGGGVFASAGKQKGTQFDVYLPLHRKEVSVDDKVLSRMSAMGKDEYILFVDDEEDLVQIARDSLTGFGYRVAAFSDSVKALACFKKNPGVFDLIISDITMPFLTGEALAREARLIRPDIPVILITGASGRMDKKIAEKMGINSVLYKPMMGYEMALSIRRVLDGE